MEPKIDVAVRPGIAQTGRRPYTNSTTDRHPTTRGVDCDRRDATATRATDTPTAGIDDARTAVIAR